MTRIWCALCARLITPPQAFCGCSSALESFFSVTPERIEELRDSRGSPLLTPQELKELCELALIGLNAIESGK